MRADMKSRFRVGAKVCTSCHPVARARARRVLSFDQDGRQSASRGRRRVLQTGPLSEWSLRDRRSRGPKPSWFNGRFLMKWRSEMD
jgi:hypothetical protein